MKPTWFMSKASLVPRANHSQYSSPVEALNLIVESKSLPVEVDNSTFELYLPRVEAKEKLAIILPVDFDFFAVMQFDMNFDDTLSDCSGLGHTHNSR